MELKSLKNIGAEIEKKLHAVGIDSAEDLVQLGSKEAFRRLKETWPEVCLVHLYALQGAIDNIDFNALAQNLKNELKAFSDRLK